MGVNSLAEWVISTLVWLELLVTDLGIPALGGLALLVILLGALALVLPLVGSILLVILSIVISLLLPIAVLYVFGEDAALIFLGFEVLLVAIIFGYMRHSKNAISKWDSPG